MTEDQENLSLIPSTKIIFFQKNLTPPQVYWFSLCLNTLKIKQTEEQYTYPVYINFYKTKRDEKVKYLSSLFVLNYSDFNSRIVSLSNSVYLITSAIVKPSAKSFLAVSLAVSLAIF